MFEGKHMFIGIDPDGKGYSTRMHIAEVIGILGSPPLDLLKRGERSHEFFTKDGMPRLMGETDSNLYRSDGETYLTGKWNNQIKVPGGMSLENSEERLSGRNKEMFLKFMRGMLQWRPEDRKTAKQLLKDPWLDSKM